MGKRGDHVSTSQGSRAPGVSQNAAKAPAETDVQWIYRGPIRWADKDDRPPNAEVAQ